MWPPVVIQGHPLSGAADPITPHKLAVCCTKTGVSPEPRTTMVRADVQPIQRAEADSMISNLSRADTPNRNSRTTAYMVGKIRYLMLSSIHGVSQAARHRQVDLSARICTRATCSFNQAIRPECGGTIRPDIRQHEHPLAWVSPAVVTTWRPCHIRKHRMQHWAYTLTSQIACETCVCRRTGKCEGPAQAIIFLESEAPRIATCMLDHGSRGSRGC